MCRKLCSLGMTVVAAGPMPFAQEETTDYYIRRGQLSYIPLDLASFHSIEESVTQFTAKFDSLHYLINNAGVMLVEAGRTQQGFETHMGVNFLGHVHLTRLLLGKLQESSRSGNRARVVNVSSSVHEIAPVSLLLSGRFYKDPPFYSSHLAYCLSKLAVVLYTECLADQLKKLNTSILACSVHPGVVSSSLYRHVSLPLRLLQQYVLRPLCFRTAEEGAAAIVGCLLSQSVAELNGCYVNGNVQGRLSSVSQHDRERFWKDVGQGMHQNFNKKLK